MRQVDVMWSWVDRWRWYRFEEEWVVDAPVETVWDGMVHVEEWPRWWEGLEFTDSPDQLPVGMEGKHYTTRWKGPLPYGLDIHAVIREASTHDSISADIHGDIEGRCTCRIEESQLGTRGVFSLDVRTTKPWMSLLSPFLKGYFSENHNRLMAKGMRGFTRHLSKGAVA
ncbi:hypothetical protein DSLASN_11130 [Desulfoluna limicola]|uniref:Polyketide cyclase / dehydrase and lipid transport n=1 Tax=Desulfoluna limicola TaxID=2810562 RepID=A0ABM7PEI8_9BACT|nr:SRPBCC family protein [Desulfoluna limicola]BCS95481.1 hypothetical protein DSLASN_11130 [Desulfoluna limicola]